MPIFNLFSKRNKKRPDVFVYDKLPPELRHQILYLWGDTILQVKDSTYDGIRARQRFPLAEQIQKSICREHGKLHLTDVLDRTPDDDVVIYVRTGRDVGLILDIVELSFQMVQKWDGRWNASQVIDELNHRFLEHGVGYQFDTDSGELIKIDNQLLHDDAVKPALEFLRRKGFETANEEFLEAFEDYKHNDLDDCLTKCCSALESVIKITCKKKGWPCDQNSDTISKLVDTLIRESKGAIPTYFADPLKIIGSLRNKLSKSHGAGPDARHVPEHLARYALHSTAAAILLVAEATK